MLLFVVVIVIGVVRVWVSPVFPPKSSSGEKESSETAAAKETDFQKDLLVGCKRKRARHMGRWRREADGIAHPRTPPGVLGCIWWWSSG